MDPEAAFLRVGLADFLSQLRRFDEAAEHLAVAYRNAPDDVDVLRRYGRIQMQLSDRGRDRAAVDRALEALKALRELAPSDIDGMLFRFQIHGALGQHKEAAAVLEGLVSYHNGNRQLQHMLVNALRQAGEDDRAQEVQADMLRFDDLSVEERLELAGTESRQGNHTRAIEMLEVWPRRSPTASQFGDAGRGVLPARHVPRANARSADGRSRRGPAASARASARRPPEPGRPLS